MSTTIDESAWTHAYARLDPGQGAIRIHYVEAGRGPLVIMLHGFPEAWFSYRYQIPVLAAAGFHVVAPDMRGYNLSDKPRGVDSYRIGLLTADVAGLIRACGAERAVVVGHDWGANVAWNFAMRYPQMLERLAILNVPHPARMLQGLRTMPAQMLKSWYIFFFQLPLLPELMLRAGDFGSLRYLLRRDPIRRGAFSEEDIERYVQAAQQPGALTAGINYYRALGRTMLAIGRRRSSKATSPAGHTDEPVKRPRRIDAPVLVIWGEHDRYFCKQLAAPPPDLVPSCRVECLPDASHWVQNDRPERVNELLLDFLRGVH